MKRIHLKTEHIKCTLAVCVLLSTILSTYAADPFSLQWEAATIVNIGSGDFAPYYIASNRAGTLTQPAGAYERGLIYKPLNTDTRFSYSFGAEAYLSVTSSTDYDRYTNDQWHVNSQKPAYVWLQQLWGEVKYRSLFLSVGMRDNNRSLFDSPLSTGDITLSRNARGVPQARLGFYDFQPVPFTRGWVEVQGEIAYGKFADNSWLRNHFNYYNSFITTGSWFHYKRIYLRSNPAARFSAMIGFQHAAQFGGNSRVYEDGKLTREYKSKVRFKDFVDVFVQKRGGDGSTEADKAYYNGNHLGSWDLKFSYRLNNGDMLTLSVQSPWEDGSGIGKLNGWDGVYGLEYRRQGYGWLTAARAEYIDFTNQSGPMHWAPGDSPDTPIHGEATGADDYYNNFFYNGWTNLGMALGTPFIKSPIYNTDGYLRFTDNRIRGFQLGAEGKPDNHWAWRTLLSWRTSWGTPYVPRIHKREGFSVMLEASHHFSNIPGLSLSAQIALDAGTLYGDRIGAAITLGYSGSILNKK